MAVRPLGPVQRLPGPSAVGCAESTAGAIGRITLGVKWTGEPGAGEPPARFDVAGAGDGFTVGLVRHSQRKRGAPDWPGLRNTAPALDPTDVAGVGDGFTAGLLRHSQRKRGATDRPGLRNTAPALDPTLERVRKANRPGQILAFGEDGVHAVRHRVL